MTEWWGVTKTNQLKKYQRITNQFVNELHMLIQEYESKNDGKKLISELNNLIKEFQNESNSK